MGHSDELDNQQRDFILKWGEAVRGWGLSRSAGRLHGLLIALSRPVAADEAATMLGVARSNVSTSMADLTAMGLVEKAPTLGERRSRYAALSDPRAMTEAVIAHQRARLFAPVAEALTAAPKGHAAELAAYAPVLGDWLEGARAPEASPVEAPPPAKKKKKKKKS